MPGIYYIEVEAYSGSNVATGTKIDMTVTVTDPCDKPNGITIKPGIFSPNPIVYQIYGTKIDLTLAPQAGITVDESEQTINCPLIEFFVVNTGVTNPAPLTTLYTWTQATQLLSIVSSDYAMSNLSYKLLVQAFYSGGTHTYQEGGSLEIQIDIGDPCDNPVSLTDPG